MRADLPTGTVTFLVSDIEGSTKLLRELGAESYAETLNEHRRVVREASERAGRLRGAAQSLRETRGRREIRVDLPHPDVPDSARDEGRAMTLEQAVDYALQSMDQAK